MSNRKSNSKQKTSLQSYKTQIGSLPFLEFAKSGTEQPGQGARLLGWPKSIYYFSKHVWIKLRRDKKLWSASPVCSVLWRDNHSDAFELFQWKRVTCAAFLFKFLWPVSLIWLLATVWRDGFSKTVFFDRKWWKQQHKCKEAEQKLLG